MRRNLLILLWLMAAGCVVVAPPKQRAPMSTSFPPDAFIVQRAILTVHGRQFTLNGYLALSRTGGKRLIVTENLGAVLADVLVKPNGSVYVERSGTLFRPEWIQHYVAGDLECIFGGAPLVDGAVQVLTPSHFLLEHSGYHLDLQILETRPGPQPPDLFDETKAPPR